MSYWAYPCPRKQGWAQVEGAVSVGSLGVGEGLRYRHWLLSEEARPAPGMSVGSEEQGPQSGRRCWVFRCSRVAWAQVEGAGSVSVYRGWTQV